MHSSNDYFSIIEQNSYVRMPWKNGLGETLEISVLRENGDVLYRISQAAVIADGVFSDFFGLNRTLVLLKGEGMTLVHENEASHYQHDLERPLSIARFAGGDRTFATLKDGAIEDLNIMVKQGEVIASVDEMQAASSVVFTADETDLFNGFYANSDCDVVIESDKERYEFRLKSQHTIVAHRPSTMTLICGTGVAIKVEREGKHVAN